MSERADRIRMLVLMVDESRRREEALRLIAGLAIGDKDVEIRLVVSGVEISPLLTADEVLPAIRLAHLRVEAELQRRESALAEARKIPE